VQQLTLRGYLSDYVRHLSGLETNNIKRLAKEAQNNYRLREPLFLYAYCMDKADLLLNFTSGSALGDRFLHVRSTFTFPELLHALELKDDALDERYHKCYNSYVRKRDMVKTYRRKKCLMRTRIIELQSAKQITTYRIYKDLGLNGSNVNSFIKNNKAEKLSLDVVRMMLNYLEKIY
jgi:hypothetical protein